MPITLITGANGHGKGQFAIKTILELQKKNDEREKNGQTRRPIYANIHGINQDGRPSLKDVQPIPSDKIFFGKQDNPDDPPPEGYFVPPIGSIFFYDECQKLDWVKQKSGALSDDIRVKSLEEHRHAGLDIYFLTQAPNYIHSHIQGLVSPHYHCERPLKMDFTNVFKFNLFEKSPNSATAHKRADDQFTINLGEKYGKYYKSSAEHNMQSEIPLKLKILVGVLVVVVMYTVYSFSKTDYADRVLNGEKQQEQNQTIAENTASQLSSINKQLNQKYLPKITAETAYNEDIRPAMIIATEHTCKAFNSYGERLLIDVNDCMMMSDDPSYIPRTRQQKIIAKDDTMEKTNTGSEL